MNSDDGAENPSCVASRSMRVWPARAFVLLLIPWALAGFFMEGEDKLNDSVSWLIVLGGGVARERVTLACQLFLQGNGRQGVILTGGNPARNASDRAMLVNACGVPVGLLRLWSTTANSFEEMAAVATLLSTHPGTRAIVVSDSLHMPRLRYIRARLALNGRVYFRQSRLGGRWDLAYLIRVVIFWFREPLAYAYYVLRY